MDMPNEIAVLVKDEFNEYKHYLILIRHGIDYHINIFVNDQILEPGITWCLDMGLLETFSIMIGEAIKPDIKMNS